MMEHRPPREPGCGGCLLIAALIVLISGGAPALMNFLGMLFFAGLTAVVLLFAALWGFSFYIQRRVSAYAASQTEAHNRFVYLLVHVLVKIAQGDGRFTKAELATILNFFQYRLNYSSDQMHWVKQLVKEARNAEVSIESLLTEFRDHFAYEPRLILIELVYQLIFTQPAVSDSDLQSTRNIAVFLEISAFDLRGIEAKYLYRQQAERAAAVPEEDRYYAVLGLEAGADFATIKKAYRKLSMQYHPDKVAHLGEEFKAVADAKMKEINAAYGYFKQRFNAS